MDFYPPIVSEKFHQPKNAGQADRANAVGTNATFVCGAVLRFSLWIDRETKEIHAAKFQTNGCGFLIAAADALAEKIVGRRLTELHSFDRQFLESEIENEIGKFSEHRTHCLDLATKTLQIALADFRRLQIEEFAGERALICTCFGVSEETIERVIAENQAQTVEQVGEVCNAGTGCGSCQLLIAELLDVGKFHEFN